MRKYMLKEDKRLPKLPVVCSDEVNYMIDYIVSRNQNQPYELKQWEDDVLSVLDHISNPNIAWNNEGRYDCDDDGIVYFDEYGYRFDYVVMTDESTHKNYVRVIYAELNPTRFGLIENKQRKGKLILTESDIRKIVRRVINEMISLRQ